MKLQHCVALGRRNYNICHAKSRAKGKFKFSVKITSNKEQFLECEKFRTTTLKNVSLGIGYHRLPHINYVLKINCTDI